DIVARPNTCSFQCNLKRIRTVRNAYAVVDTQIIRKFAFKSGDIRSQNVVTAVDHFIRDTRQISFDWSDPTTQCIEGHQFTSAPHCRLSAHSTSRGSTLSPPRCPASARWPRPGSGGSTLSGLPSRTFPLACQKRRHQNRCRCSQLPAAPKERNP